MNAADILESDLDPDFLAYKERMAAFEAKHGISSLAEFDKPTSHTPRALVAYGPDEEDEFTQPTPQPLSALEKLQASGPADIDEIIAAYKTDNGIVDQPLQDRRSRRKAGDIERAAQAARQYLEQDGGAQPVEAVLAAVLDATGLTVPESGKGRTRFLHLAGLESRPHNRPGRAGREYTEWVIPQDSQVQVTPESASSPQGQSASNPTVPESPYPRSASNPAQSASNPWTLSGEVQVTSGKSASNSPASASILSRLLSRGRVSHAFQWS